MPQVGGACRELLAGGRVQDFQVNRPVAVAAPGHLTRRHSWLRSPVRVTSATTRQTAPGGAPQRASARPALATPRAVACFVLALIILLNGMASIASWPHQGPSRRAKTPASQAWYSSGVHPGSSVSSR